jgi:hypothetical protein
MPGIENFSYFASGIVWTGKRFNRRPTTHPQPLANILMKGKSLTKTKLYEKSIKYDC